MSNTEKINKLVELLIQNPCNESIKGALEELQKECVPAPSVEKRIYRSLNKLGFTSSLMGYEYCRCGIQLIMKDDEYRNSIVGLLYPKIAELHGTTGCRVEGAIRHSIESAWIRGDPETAEEIFLGTVSPDKGKPTNAEFLSHMAKYISLGCDLE